MNALVAKGRERGISFAIRGNLIILAPPLVIGENELGQALGVLDTLLTEIDFT
jgi:taurine--2-oxoglutarate transaminase